MPIQKIVSLEPIRHGSWFFKVSANDIEEGVLVVAANPIFNYYRCKYFSDSGQAREWINLMVSYTKEAIDMAIAEIEAYDLKNKA